MPEALPAAHGALLAIEDRRQLGQRFAMLASLARVLVRFHHDVALASGGR